MPRILDNCISDIMREQGLPRSRAFAICTASQQKAGILKPGSQELTVRGRKRQTALAAMAEGKTRRKKT